ncbi:hypothetical protein ACM26E_11520 [Kluyvera cryocrescens]|uniref:hypothetical protein n=1 Tax=Kluyvera cryocrescens TaxID=580 RepID=UPI0039F487A6
MLMDTTGQLPGRRKFLEQRAILQNSLTLTRANDTATRFDRLDETRKKVVFMLANEAASRVAGMPQLTRRHLDTSFASLSEAEQATLLLGIKRLAEFAAALPWEFEDYAAPRAEIQAIRDKPAEPEKPTN